MIACSGTSVCEYERRLCSRNGGHGSAGKDGDDEDKEKKGSQLKMPFGLLSKELWLSIDVEESRVA